MKNLVKFNLKTICLLSILVLLSFACQAQKRQWEEDQLGLIISEKSNWAFNMNLFAGYGSIGRDLGRRYTSNVYYGMDIGLYYKWFVVDGGVSYGYGLTKTDITYSSGVWEKGNLYECFNLGFSIGHIVANEKNYKLTPFVGMVFFSVGIPDGEFFDPDDEFPSVTFDEVTYYSAGLNFDLKIGPRKNDPTTFESCRLRYGYNFSTQSNNYMHTISIGLNMCTKSFNKR